MSEVEIKFFHMSPDEMKLMVMGLQVCLRILDGAPIEVLRKLLHAPDSAPADVVKLAVKVALNEQEKLYHKLLKHMQEIGIELQECTEHAKCREGKSGLH